MGCPIKYSFLLITYNQERFVEEAFYSCINQTCGNYEIVVSDDNSHDNTFSILKRLVDDYKKSGGKIPVILNKNEKNLGIGGNFQKAAELSHGKWLLMAAGDDMSLPTRIETVDKLIKRHPEIYGINTARFFVDENGENAKYVFKRGYLLGADSVWHRKVFTDFRPLDERVMSEDHVLNLRALLLGGMIQVNTPTIKYRISSQNISIHKAKDILDAKLAEIKKIDRHLNLLYFRMDDIEDCRIKKGNTEILSLVKRKIEQEKNDLNRQKESYSMFIRIYRGSISEKIRYLFSSNRIWLHSNFAFRLYNLIKMTHLINERPNRKDTWSIEARQDDKEYVITINDFINQREINLF